MRLFYLVEIEDKHAGPTHKLFQMLDNAVKYAKDYCDGHGYQRCQEEIDFDEMVVRNGWSMFRQSLCNGGSDQIDVTMIRLED